MKIVFTAAKQASFVVGIIHISIFALVTNRNDLVPSRSFSLDSEPKSPLTTLPWSFRIRALGFRSDLEKCCFCRKQEEGKENKRSLRRCGLLREESTSPPVLRNSMSIIGFPSVTTTVSLIISSNRFHSCIFFFSFGVYFLSPFLWNGLVINNFSWGRAAKMFMMCGSFCFP